MTATVQNTVRAMPAMAHPTQPPSNPRDDTAANPSRAPMTPSTPVTMTLLRPAGDKLLDTSSVNRGGSWVPASAPEDSPVGVTSSTSTTTASGAVACTVRPGGDDGGDGAAGCSSPAVTPAPASTAAPAVVRVPAVASGATSEGAGGRPKAAGCSSPAVTPAPASTAAPAGARVPAVASGATSEGAGGRPALGRRCGARAAFGTVPHQSGPITQHRVPREGVHQ
jgi:hypothetical protein